MSVFAPSGDLSELDPTKRVSYSLGMIVGDDELRQDQRYVMARDDRHQRALHGWGVASGLDLGFRVGGELEVRPGLAVDGNGRSVCVPVAQCADLAAWIQDNSAGLDLGALPDTVPVWVVLCHDECATDLLPVPSGPCRTLEESVQPSRIRDSFRLELTFAEPPTRGDLDEIPESGVLPLLLDEDAEVDDKRTALSDFVTSRGDADAFANRCLDPLEPGCVPLGRVDVPLAVDGTVVSFDAPPDPNWIDTDSRPIVLSTQFLQEWLLRVEGGGSVPEPLPAPEPEPIPLDDLADVNAPTAEEGVVVYGVVDPADVGTGMGTDAPPPTARWEERPLVLDLLGDVEIPSNFGGTPSDRDLVLKFDGSVWRPQRDEVGGTTPAPHDPHVLSRPQNIAIVAAGVLVQPLERIDDTVGWAVGDDPTFLTAYGGLEAKLLFEMPGSVLYMLRFPGYAEAMAGYPELAGRQFVVKLTPEGDNTRVDAQVVAMTEEGILVALTAATDQNRWRRLLVGAGLADRFDREPAIALHVEITAFDDRFANNDVLIKVDSLRGDVR